MSVYYNVEIYLVFDFILFVMESIYSRRNGKPQTIKNGKTITSIQKKQKIKVVNDSFYFFPKKPYSLRGENLSEMVATLCVNHTWYFLFDSLQKVY